MYGEEAWEYARNQVQKSPFVWFCLVKVWTSHFYGSEWSYLFQVDIQSNDELGLVMMERNACLSLRLLSYICYLGYDHTTKSTN